MLSSQNTILHFVYWVAFKFFSLVLFIFNLLLSLGFALVEKFVKKWLNSENSVHVIGVPFYIDCERDSKKLIMLNQF